MTNYGCTALALKPIETNHPNGSVQKSQDRKAACQVRTNVNVLLNRNSVVHHKFLAQDRPVNKEYNIEVMLWLSEAIRQKRTELWKN